jgi:hypothetical protein
MKSLAYEREEMRVNITNYTRYNSDDLGALVKDMAQYYAKPRDTGVFHMVVDTYRPVDTHAPTHDYVDGEYRRGHRPQWVNTSNHEREELRIVSPDRMPIPTPASLAIMGSTDPCLPQEAVLYVAYWAATQIAGTYCWAGWKYGRVEEIVEGQDGLLSSKDFVDHYCKENNPRIRIEKSVETKRPRVSRKRYSWAEKKLSLTERVIRNLKYQADAAANEIDSHLANAKVHLEKVGATAEIKQLEVAQAFMDEETIKYRAKLQEFENMQMRVSADLSVLSRGGK